MSTVSVTRMELLARKAQIALASQGHDLLEQKRTALLKEFLRMADTAMERSDALQFAATNARHALARAEAIAGKETVCSAALASRAELPLQVTTTRIMGVKVPYIEQKHVSRSMLGRGFAITDMSITIDEAASAFESEVEAIIELAEMELRLTRLAEILTVAEIRPQIVDAHGRDGPGVFGGDGKRGDSRSFDRIQDGKEFALRPRRFKAKIVEDILIVDEAVNHGRHGHAESGAHVIG